MGPWPQPRELLQTSGCGPTISRASGREPLLHPPWAHFAPPGTSTQPLTLDTPVPMLVWPLPSADSDKHTVNVSVKFGKIRSFHCTGSRPVSTRHGPRALQVSLREEGRQAARSYLWGRRVEEASPWCCWAHPRGNGPHALARLRGDGPHALAYLCGDGLQTPAHPHKDGPHAGLTHLTST